MKQDIVLCGGKRTPFGDFGKSLAGIAGTDLGIHAAKSCLNAIGLAAEKVDHLVCGNVVPVDQGGYFSALGGELDTWSTTHDERTAWLADRGIRHRVFLAPNKHTISPSKISRSASLRMCTGP